jgi:DNA-binding response OmpR family regulator
LKELRVLIGNDEADIRESITIVLELRGMSVKAAASAAKAGFEAHLHQFA